MTGYAGPIEKQTTENTYFRQVLFTGPQSQLVVMCLRPGEDIGDEVHPHVDQFFRIEKGQAKFGCTSSEEHTSELQSPCNLVCRLLLEKKTINMNCKGGDSCRRRGLGVCGRWGTR